jgi:CRISPR-associated exonuclease Cas4
MDVTGLQVHYFFVCKRKLWLYSNGIEQEYEDENVKIGKYYHENEFEDEEKQDNDFIEGIKVDKITDEYVVEYKKSNASLESSKWQLLFYLWKLKKKGIDRKGVLKFKENRDNIEVELTENKEQKLKSIIEKIKEIISQPTTPSRENCSEICNKSAYSDFNRV